MARRSEDRSPITEDDKAVSTLSPSRIECEVDVLPTGQATKLAQQLIAVHRPCIASAGAAVKSGTPPWRAVDG
jgi:hypothetical protein